MTIQEILASEETRKYEFPVTQERVFLAHAGVCPLPRCACEAIEEFCRRGSRHAQETGWANGQVLAARQVSARVLGCSPDEIALLGPTSLGLSLVANGIPWEPGDEVVYYPDDYPANVYPWTELERRGVRPVALAPERPGAIAWETVEAALTPRTRLVTLATCNFLSGYRVDVNDIGRRLRERGVLFCLDAIQTLGAFPLLVEHVDFLSADSHKWMLGPAGAGIVYIRKERQGLLRPSLLGSWNVRSPEFVAQDTIEFEPGGRGYEPGMLNLPGIIGMTAALKLLEDAGIDQVAGRILELRRELVERLLPLGFEIYGHADNHPESSTSGILTVRHPTKELKPVAQALEEEGITVSCRQNRAGDMFLRFSPHFYNTSEELDRVVEVLKRVC
ncbi:MAG: aminotransferase [Candidatus Hydrogenedentota bacterium]